MRIKKPNLKLQTTITLLVCCVIAISLLVTNLLISAKVAYNTEKNLEDKATYIARIVANSPSIIEALNGKKDEKVIQEMANNMKNMTNVEYIVVMDMNQTRKSHPDIAKLGKHFVGDDVEEALKGHEYVSTAEGTLGMALRAFTPIFTSDGRQIGVVAVGILLNNVHQAVAQSRIIIYIGVGFGFLVGLIGAMLLAKSIKKTMFGLEPSEISKLLEERSAMLHSVREGILAVDKDSRITLINEEAMSIFSRAGITDPMGKKVEECIQNTRLNHILQTGQAELDQEQELKGITLLTNRIPIFVKGETVGAIATFRDKTEIRILAEQLTGVRLYADALRAQTHEFMNKLHIILGMVHMKYYDELAEYINSIADKYQEQVGFVIRHIKDPVLAGFILGKISYSREIGVQFVLSEECFVPEPEENEITHEIATILGNLVDNAMDAVKDYKDKIVNLTLVYEDDILTIEVSDSGPGISGELKNEIFAKGYSTKGDNRGLGLYLVQKSVERLGGNMQLFSEVGDGTTFIIYLPYKSKDGVE
ncbi:DcuS/MalK family sensor histidine kinase [Clostridium magnum]|uniref:histidine kinase n=1 Tax=Clostridium magnum DSM 2767 TaxID=1121326 RepID=A0A161YH71_9CLOT|nr:DcuS/MalK family sensor histidine kinase [Clostridium magnum]KZL89552.1 sensor histidine kinase DcuS [Clostridium magnum DSM 2767]SHH72200.1 two-component system, CitB family, sensor histidine kinase MalK [Clostridium magnum DSM 2767]